MAPFQVFLIYHSHIDIGYTERQEKIAVYQADFIKQAVDNVLSPRQAERDEKTKFRFSAEGFWAVEQYLKRYGDEGKARLVEAVKTGYFELTGGYFHMAELLNYENLSHTLDYAADFAAENGLKPLHTAMACDINGFSWGYADALYDHGIRCLSTCINTHHGDGPFSRPLVPFWWQSPKGRKVLVWSGLTYHKANRLGMIPGLAPGGGPGITGMSAVDSPVVDVQSCDYPYSRLKELVEVLKKDGYPYDFIPLMGSGLYTDNSPADDTHCRLMAELNETYGEEIQVRTATMEEFFAYLQEHGGDFPTYAGDWNDWWTDGVLSTPNETKLFRNAQRLEALTRKLDPAMEIVSPEEHETIRKNLMIYAEHTWGHSDSCWEPYRLLVTQLDLRKGKLAVDADILASTAYDKVARALGEGEFTTHRPFTYRVVNPHDFPKREVVYLPTDYWEDGWFLKNGFRVEDQDGTVLASQRTETLRGAAIACCVELQPHEVKNLRLVFSPEIPKQEEWKQKPVEDAGIFENAHYVLTYGTKGITSLVHKESGEEVLDSAAPSLGAPVYQLFPKGKRWQAAGWDYGQGIKPEMEIHHAVLTSLDILEQGPVFTHLRAAYEIKGAAEAFTHYYLYHDLPKLMVTAEIAKELVRDPEGMYVSLPFRAKEGEWYLDKAGAFFHPGEQLPQGCCDYYPVNRGLVLSGASLGVAVNTLDTPLVMINGLKLWDYSRKAERSGPVYSWLTNNKWETNFRTQCAGYLESRYVIEINSSMKTPETGLNVLESNEYEVLAVRN